MIWSKNELSEMLRKNVVEVSFIKKDGSGRVMKCSLQEKYLPEFVTSTAVDKKTRRETPDAIAVWDIDSNGWRSFRLDSIINVKQL